MCAVIRFQLAGPNTAVAVETLIPILEAQADYIVACIDKIQRQRIKAMTVRKEAVDDFQRYLDAYFPRTVFARKVRFMQAVGRQCLTFLIVQDMVQARRCRWKSGRFMAR